MQRIAVFSDVHANAPALRQRLSDIEAAGIERIWNLGDFCSGGPHPVECFELCTARCEINLLGNHELFVLTGAWRQLSGGWARAAMFAHAQLGVGRVAALKQLPVRDELDWPPVELVHGSPVDPTGGLIETPEDAQQNVRLATRSLVLFGHTHRRAYWSATSRATSPSSRRSRPDTSNRSATASLC